MHAEPGRPLEGLVVGHVGHHDPDYARNRLMAKALRRAGARVVDLSDRRRFAARAVGFVRAIHRVRPDLVLVGFPGHADVPVARLAARHGVPVVFDALVSLYETAVEDRQIVDPRGVKGRRYLLQDRLACRAADVVLLDTDAHVEYFRERFGGGTRYERVFVGSDDEIMRPQPPDDHTALRLCFYATYIPLHGAEHVVAAAHLLERAGVPVELVMIGVGQTHAEARRVAESTGTRSVQFVADRVAYDQLPAIIASCDVNLGVFGTTGKAARVIPNKVYDGLAAARTVVTADTAAIREVLTDGVDCRTCPPGDPEALATVLTELYADREAARAIACRGHDLFRERFSLDALARRLGPLVREVVDG
jgi:glycosyltransferase involved in cell wall biosynthesis